jgi:hypothetical protein
MSPELRVLILYALFRRLVAITYLNQAVSPFKCPKLSEKMSVFNDSLVQRVSLYQEDKDLPLL